LTDDYFLKNNKKKKGIKMTRKYKPYELKTFLKENRYILKEVAELIDTNYTYLSQYLNDKKPLSEEKYKILEKLVDQNRIYEREDLIANLIDGLNVLITFINEEDYEKDLKDYFNDEFVEDFAKSFEGLSYKNKRTITKDDISELRDRVKEKIRYTPSICR
jgi:transcriptional regulator with XRE-family HTH domain